MADLKAESWERIERDSGIARAQIQEMAQICLKSKRTIACWAMGLTQAPKSVQTIQMVMNLLLLGGHIGRPGAGPCPVRGHSNVQGDRTVGINERPPKAFLDKLGKEFGFTPPDQHGVGVVDCIKGMHAGRIKVFIAMGGSFLSATPDTELTAQALTRTQLTAHVATKLNRGHLITGKTGLILPCLGRSEIDRQATGPQFVTVEDSMGVINRSQGHLEPASPHLLSEAAIAAALAKATLGDKAGLDWDAFAANYDLIRDRLERVIPGFEDYNARVRREVFYLPNAPRDQRKWNNAAGKAKFATHELPDISQEKGELIMMTIRTHDQFNTTVYGLDDRYRGVFNGRRVIFLNEADMRELGLQAGQMVDITSHWRGQKRLAQRFQVTPYDVTRGACATYFPEANVLVPVDSIADESHTPTSKFVRVTLAPSPDTRTAAAAILRDAREIQRGGPQLQPA